MVIHMKKKPKNKTISKSNSNRKKEKRRTLKKWALITIIIFLLFIATSNIIILVKWKIDNKKTNENIKEIQNTTPITEIDGNENTENISEPTNKESDYWYYITIPLISVDFDELMKKNSDTVAWISVNSTNINYPVVQYTDNNYYLTHSFDKSKNEAGWVFLDYRNNTDLTSKNNIIYAHSRLDKTMFGSLSKVLKDSWYQDKSNHIIRISTPTEDSLWQIFSIYTIKEETYYLTTQFTSDEDYLNFLNTLKNRSKFSFDITFNSTDKILTLSTCYSDTQRTVVHAKLIKKLKR